MVLRYCEPKNRPENPSARSESVRLEIRLRSTALTAYRCPIFDMWGNDSRDVGTFKIDRPYPVRRLTSTAGLFCTRVDHKLNTTLAA
jgi:hypothetical protein